MATFKRPFGSDKVTNNTSQKSSEDNTSDVPTQKTETKDSTSSKSVNKELWAEAERAALNQTGGFSGSTEEGRRDIIQAKYDQMVESDKQLKKDFGAILGDV